MSVLQTVDLKKYYGTEPNITRALDGVNFSVEDGEFVAVVGTSGSGKSTLLHMMGGLDTPTSGNVIVRGKELSKMNDEQLTIFRRRNIGFIFTPREAGRTELTLKVSYEDANQTLRTLSFPVTLEVQEAFDADLELDDLPDEEPQSGFGLWFWLAGGTAVVLIGGGVIWMRRRKNAAQTELSHASDENWDDWDDLQEPSETESGSNNPEDDAE